MKEFETTNKKVIQQLSTIEKRSGESPNTTSKGTITVEEKYGTIRFERRLKHPKEIVWKAITEQKEIFKWLPDYNGTFDGSKGGTIDLLNVVSGSHVTGKVLV
jgi:hypothetical protein